MARKGYVYILTNKNHTVFYTGITSNLPQRMEQHKTGSHKTSFTPMNNPDYIVSGLKISEFAGRFEY